MSAETVQVVDATKAEVFAGRLLTALNDGALCLMVSIGHRTGLFDVMGQSPPSTSEELAASAGLNERYVREWLGAMATARVVDVDPATARFSLPAEHGAFLRRASGADNLAVLAQYVAVMGGVEDDIVQCFKKGGGVPYERFHRFHEVMAEDSGQSVAVDLSDFDERAEPDSFDFITTFDAVHDQARPLSVLKGIHRALKPNGTYLMQDIGGTSHVHRDIEHPIGTFLYTVSCMHCMTVSLAQGGEGVGAMWGEEMTRDYLERAGFRSITTHRLAHDIQNNWYVVTK